ncbi:hypothetical protein AJ79_04100 [Helicocarpus griseus UAMH5409]|uniref:Aminoglycoside phosphotransferase domain-containing protein n=1 Tax=Helicocarpus griseus UAMH5409 TaxID=1447875 RepID=A0A2B7XUT8_9EURO|nr:hypothetical protein AJ79_04100 [Helicocarpus griseus UAMH5409]
MSRVFPDNWIGRLWDGYELCCREKTVWRIGEKISERSILMPSHPSTGQGRAEAQAVYHCKQIVQGRPNNTRAIIKVRMQVPFEYPPSLNSAVRASLAQQQPSGWTLQELQSLRYFNAKKCTVVPKLLNVVWSWQSEPDMPVPKGYLVFNVMEKVPGVSLAKFWGYNLPKRDKIRASFRRSLTELLNLGARASDCRLDNLIYDEETDTCYFVDFEDIEVKENSPVKFSPDHYFIWGLAKDINCQDVY